MEFHKLSLINGSFSITHKKPFPANAPALKQETVRRVFEFAYSMTFGAVGEHRDHRTGGSLQRKNGEIFANTFQGKLAECAACNLFYKLDPSVMPDFTIAKLGVWDSVDVIVNHKKIAVKSTKSFGNLLLLEQHDWDENGDYIPNSATATLSDIIDFESKLPSKYYYTPGKFKGDIYEQLLKAIDDDNAVYQWRRKYVRKNKSGVVPTLTANQGEGGHNVCIINTKHGIRKMTPHECFNAQGFSKDFILPENMSDARLYKQAGNSVCVSVISRIAEKVAEAYKTK